MIAAHRWVFAAASVATLVGIGAQAAGCNQILGVEERTLAGEGGTAGASPAGGAGGELDPAGGGGAGGGADCRVEACGLTCAELLHSPDHCGLCGRACADGEVCTNGVCDRRMRSSPATYTPCARSDSGLVCWGNDDRGQMGNGQAVWGALPPELVVSVPASEVRLAGGAIRSTCAVMMDGSVRCFGNNGGGSLGLGPDDGGPDDGAGAPQCCFYEEAATPLLAPVLQFADVAGGGHWDRAEHYCALATSGEVYCWGTAAETPIPKVDGAIQIEAGLASQCALLATGDVYCWVPQKGATQDNAVAAGLPFRVEGLPPIRAIGFAHDTSFAIDVSGAVWAWGGSERGLLGPGTPIDGNRYYPPRPFGADLGSAIAQITGTAVSACALLESGDVYCWGKDGWLGDGAPETETFSSTPKKALVEDIVEIASSQDTLFARGADGRIHAWGGGRPLPVTLVLP